MENKKILAHFRKPQTHNEDHVYKEPILDTFLHFHYSISFFLILQQNTFSLSLSYIPIRLSY